MRASCQCPGFQKLREEAERRKKPSWNELKGTKSEVEPGNDSKQVATAAASRAAPPRAQADPGLVNPAFEETEDDTPLRCSLVAETNVVEIFREEPEEELGIRIVGGKDTPLGNIVIQDILRDSLAARDGRLAPGDHVLELVGDLETAAETCRPAG
ncbi:ligand of Numb protein X 2-like [Arapaima gigas]